MINSPQFCEGCFLSMNVDLLSVYLEKRILKLWFLSNGIAGRSFRFRADTAES